ncbi:MAG: RQC domain-containing protein, partial [Oscillospiraceae bacterium]
NCILLYSGQDVVMNQFLISHGEDTEGMDEETRALLLQQSRERLKVMTFYCHTNSCLRAYILRYFGEESPIFCGNCFNCNHTFEELDITLAAQKILSCIKRTGERYGVKMIVDILRGSKGERLLRLGLQTQTTYGLLRELSESQLRDVIHFLILEGFLGITDTEYPSLFLGSRAVEVLSSRIPLSVKLAKETEKIEKKTKASSMAPQGQHPRLLAQLRALRVTLAAAQHVPAYIVFTNAALEDMCAKLPRTPAEFSEVSGVGKAKLEKYGAAFLAAISTYVDSL